VFVDRGQNGRNSRRKQRQRHRSHPTQHTTAGQTKNNYKQTTTSECTKKKWREEASKRLKEHSDRDLAGTWCGEGFDFGLEDRE
jgi:hypothetical protein